MTKTCPECKSEVADEALVCRFCSERIEGKPCPHCLALCKEEAAICRSCRFEFEPSGKLVELEPFSIIAERVPTVAFRFRLLPQELHFSRDKITVTTPGVFRLWIKEEEIPWHKIAGFKYREGIFWDGVHIETRGQSSSEVKGLRKDDGATVRNILRQLEE